VLFCLRGSWFNLKYQLEDSNLGNEYFTEILQLPLRPIFLLLWHNQVTALLIKLLHNLYKEFCVHYSEFSAEVNLLKFV